MNSKRKTSSTPRSGIDLIRRPRRNRRCAGIRAMVRETRLSPAHLIQPLFVIEGRRQSIPVASMPGIERYSRDLLVRKARETFESGIPAVALFPALPEKRKDKRATGSRNPKGLLQMAVGDLKSALPDLVVITDVAMDPYSSDGHDGLVKNGRILNDETLEILAAMAVSQARAGADIVAPSDMMDGRVGFIRRALDRAGFRETGILSYAVKYASAFYGPFRDALDSAPRGGDKKTYQMDPANRREALLEARLDVKEGADMVMVKPALPYLDVIREVRRAVDVPVAAYHVSGEYAMIKAAAEKGWLNEESAVMEALTGIRRAGADMILTYFAGSVANRLQDA